MTNPTNFTCPGCSGAGFLLNQTYGYADIPDGWTPVQRCDECAVFDGDRSASAAAARRLLGVLFMFPMTRRYIDAEGDMPGDYVIRTVTMSGRLSEIGRTVKLRVGGGQ